MASGRPDYTSQVLIKGSDAGTLRSVGLDSSGNILTLMKGQYGGAPVTVAVDSSGRILGVLQGDYAGSFKTLAVDNQGRMLAVLTDPEDVFGNPHYMGAAELAARLGSPAVFDRRGQVVFQDPGGVNVGLYLTLTSGAESSITEFSFRGVPGALSYRLRAGTAEDNYAQMGKYIPRISTSKAGLEWVALVDPNNARLDVVFEMTTATNRYRGGIRTNTTDNKLYLWSSAGSWSELQAIPFNPTTTAPHVYKLVIDEATQKYVRLQVDRNVIDLSAQSLQSVVALGGPNLYMEVTLYCGDLGTVTEYISGLLVTVNEV